MMALYILDDVVLWASFCVSATRGRVPSHLGRVSWTGVHACRLYIFFTVSFRQCRHLAIKLQVFNYAYIIPHHLCCKMCFCVRSGPMSLYIYLRIFD